MNRLSKNEEKLKEMLNAKQFEYNPAHWQEAEKMLDAETVASKLKFKAIWLTLPILIVVAGIIKWTAPPHQNAVVNNIQTQAPIAIDKENTDNQEATIAQNNSSVIPFSPQPKGGYNSANAETVNKLPTKTDSKTSKVKSKKTDKPLTTVNTPIKKQVPTKIEKRKDKPNNITPTTKDKIAKKDNPTPAIQANKDDDPEPKPKNVAVNTIEKKKPTNTDDNLSPELTTTDDKEATDKEEKKEKAKKKNVEPKQILLKNSVSIIAALNYSSLIQTQGNGYVNTPYFGIQYQHLFSQKWQLNTGLGYSYVKANNLNKEYSKQQYSFGLASKSTNISTDRLHYLELPVLAKYSAFDKLTIVTGASLSYLLNTNNTIINTNNTNTIEQTKANQYRRGINPFDVQIQFGVEYKINNNLHLGLLANAGLLDVSKNNYYNSAVFNRNNRLQLYIKYDFLRF